MMEVVMLCFIRIFRVVDENIFFWFRMNGYYVDVCVLWRAIDNFDFVGMDIYTFNGFVGKRRVRRTYVKY